METPTPDPHSGAVLDGRYVLGERLRSDASGSAYAAHDRATGTTVVVTVLHPWLVGDAPAVHAFRGRAQHLEAVSHPGLARFLDHGRDGDRVYAVNEYLRGEPLAEVLDGASPVHEPHRALTVIASVLEALDAAHAQGIVHGALTPDRVVVGDDGRAGITGFPLLFDAAEDEAPDTRTDVRAVGLLLHALITGEPADPGEARPLRPSALVDSLPPDLDMLVANATDPNPRYRPRDAGQYLTLVEQVMRSLSRPLEEGGADTTRPIPIAAAELPAPRRGPLRRRVPVLAAAVLLVAALFATGWALFPREPEATLPDLAGVAAEEAEARLESLGLGLVVRFRDTYHDTVEPGGVAGSEPGPGAVLAEGDAVMLALSVGPRHADVPDVVGDTENEARDLLREAGFTRIDVVQEHSAEQLPGTVLATEPAAGREGDREDPVVIRVSEGVIVPSLDGMTQEEAVDALTRVGLTAVVVEQHHETVEPGGVSAQNPEPGSILPEEGEVSVTVSTGPEPEEEPSESPSETPSEESEGDRDEESDDGDGGGHNDGHGGGQGGGWDDHSCSAPAWSPGTTYEEGERVSHNGREYESRWWNQDNEPDSGTLWGPWSDRGRC
ncbi:PASTA domain-containing protein [Nocardiopsis sp. NPDC057823]|uniref:PASTA domain-containing protein n=1 Tax=Nocardiopsis sp. NPDC057823 TaxID=3346256 RepID=UPI0015982584|nr:PASTA domain-containing protein [Nocardiopsis flavescens]